MLSRSAVLAELHNWGLVLHYGNQAGLGVQNLWSSGGGEYTLDVDAAWRVNIYLTKWEVGSGSNQSVVEAIAVLKSAHVKSDKATRLMKQIGEDLGISRQKAGRRYNLAIETMQRCYSINELNFEIVA